MKAHRMIYDLVLADVRERTRRYSFLVTMLGTLFFGYLVITGKWTIVLGDCRGVYNSAWVGSLMGSASTVMLAFFGFFLVKNSLSRDRHTGVGQILAATQLSNSAYLASKFISNFVVLTLMASILATAAVAMQLLSHVEGGFHLWALVAPFLFVCLPVMALVAAMAVLFESTRWLRGTVGNILYIIIAEFAFVGHLLFHNPFIDFGGFGMFKPSMEAAALAAYPDADLGFEIGFVGLVEDRGNAIKLFVWEGIDWSLGMVPLRLLWISCAVCITGVATLGFDRFDPARAKRGKPAKRAKKPSPGAEVTAAPAPASPSWVDMTPVRFRFDPVRMLAADLRLMLKGHHWSWYLGAAGLLALQVALPYEYARTYALPAAWVWPLAIWSAMGAREARYDTSELLFSSAYPVSRQFPAVWLAGVVVALLAGGGMLVRALLGGEIGQFRALLVGVLFVPTLALALGTVSGSRKLFEVTYLLVWYVGPVHGLAPLDFLGTTDVASTGSVASAYLLASVVMGAVAFLWRRRRVAYGRG